MIIEALTLSSIIGASGLAVWFAKIRFQPAIERTLTKTNAAPPVEETAVANRRVSNKQN